MNKDLKRIEQEVIDELSSKFKDDNGAAKVAQSFIKISAQVTRLFLEKYENEMKKD